LSYFFSSSSSSPPPPSAINLFLLKKHKSRKNSAQISHLFLQKKRFYTERRERDCYGGVVGGGVQCRPGTTTKRLFADKQTNKRRWRQRQDGAGVIFVAKVAMIPQSRFSQIWLQANYEYIIYIDIFYIFG
jgi:hypothetical protein